MEKPVLKDPKIDVVRHSFLSEFSRLCLLLALGHFFCIPPLYFLFAGAIDPDQYRHYTLAITLGGAALSIIAFLCRYVKLRATLVYLFFAVLFSQTCYILYQVKALIHPVTMLLPTLSFLALPLFGRMGAYGVAVLSGGVLTLFHFVKPRPGGNEVQGMEEIAPLMLMVTILGLYAYISDILWSSMIKREAKLKAAIREMELWVSRLEEVSSDMTAGKFEANMPQVNAYPMFSKLTENLGYMQERLKGYLGKQFLQDRLSSIGILATGIAHELHTPLTSLSFLIEVDETLSPEGKKALTAEIERMTRITKQLLRYSRPQEESDVVDLNQVVRDIEPFLARFNRKTIPIKWEFCSSKLIINCTENLLQQIIMNLFQNAVDALEHVPDPHITIQTHELEKQATFRIIDNGCGMPKEIQQKVIDPFFTTKEPGKGTGMGLFLVHQIVKSHGAQLEIKSEPSKGTEISAYFPLKVSSEKEAA